MTELFEKYYTNTLSEEERNSFELRIKTDSSFAEDYEAYVLMMEHMDSKEAIHSALSVLDDVHSNSNDVKPPPRGNNLRFLVAILILLASACILYFWLSSENKEIENDMIFASNFQPATISIATKGDDLNAQLMQINSDYRKKEYTSVINSIDQLNIDSLALNELYLMLGSARIATNDFEGARRAMQPLENSAQFRNDYFWYTSMSYLGEGKFLEAKAMLREIPIESNY